MKIRDAATIIAPLIIGTVKLSFISNVNNSMIGAEIPPNIRTIGLISNSS